MEYSWACDLLPSTARLISNFDLNNFNILDRILIIELALNGLLNHWININNNNGEMKYEYCILEVWQNSDKFYAIQKGRISEK